MKNNTKQKSFPKKWQRAKLGSLGTVMTGGTPNTSIPKYWGGDIRWMSSGEVNQRRIYDTEKRITEEGLRSSNATMLPTGAVMIALAGQGKTRGKVAVLEVETTCNQSLAAVIPDKEKLTSDFLFYSLEDRYQELRNISGGEGRAGLNLRLIKDFEILIPSPLEQKRIAEILVSVDDEITKIEKIISATEKLNRGLMQNLLAFKGKADVRKLALKEIGKVAMCKRVFKKETLSHGEIPFYKIGTFGKDPDAFISQKLYDTYREKFSFPKKGDILLSASGTIGRKVRYDGKPAYFQDSNIIWLEHNESKVLNDFLFYLYDSIEWQTEGSTIKRLYNDLFLKKVIPVPPIEEQRKVISILSSVEQKILISKKIRSTLLQLKKGLMQDLLTGKVRTI